MKHIFETTNNYILDVKVIIKQGHTFKFDEDI